MTAPTDGVVANGVSNGFIEATAKHEEATFGLGPPDDRVEVGSVNILPAKFPSTPLPESANPHNVADDLFRTINEQLSRKDYSGIASLFSEDGYWRDHLCLSWDFRTLKGPNNISDYLTSNGGKLESISLDKSAPCREPCISQLDAFGKSKCVAFFIKVTTDISSGQGVVRLIYENHDWKIIAFYTALRDLKGFEEPLGVRRPVGASHGGDRNMKNWFEQRLSDANFDESEPAVLIIGMSALEVAHQVMISVRSILTWEMLTSMSRRCWTRRSHLSRTSQDAQGAHPSDRSGGPSRRQLAPAISPARAPRPHLVRPHAVHGVSCILAYFHS